MSEFPALFSPEESRARFMFQVWFNTFFELSAKPTNTFPSGLKAEHLYEMFQAQMHEKEVTLHIVKHMLQVGGFIVSDNVVHCRFKISELKYANEDFLRLVSNKGSNLLKISLLQKQTARPSKSIVASPLLDYSVNMFIKTQAITSKDPIMYLARETYPDCEFKTLYSYYVLYCTMNTFSILSKNAFKHELIKFGLKTRKGYFSKRSGTTGVQDLIIDIEPNWIQHIQRGMAVFDIRGSLVFNTGIEIKTLKEPAILAKYINQRRDEIEQSCTQKKTVEETLNAARAADESIQKAALEGKAEIFEAAKIHDLNGLFDGSKRPIKATDLNNSNNNSTASEFVERDKGHTENSIEPNKIIYIDDITYTDARTSGGDGIVEDFQSVPRDSIPNERVQSSATGGNTKTETVKPKKAFKGPKLDKKFREVQQRVGVSVMLDPTYNEEKFKKETADLLKSDEIAEYWTKIKDFYNK